MLIYTPFIKTLCDSDNMMQSQGFIESLINKIGSGQKCKRLKCCDISQLVKNDCTADIYSSTYFTIINRSRRMNHQLVLVKFINI